MQISYGPPGHKGVTHLMAVGADEFPPSEAERLIAIGAATGIGLLLYGLLAGRKRAFHIGVGATLATLPAYIQSRQSTKVVGV